jgi:hypothetical protein
MAAFILVPKNSACNDVAPKVDPGDGKYLSILNWQSAKLNIQVAASSVAASATESPSKAVGNSMAATFLKSTSTRVENFSDLLLLSSNCL